MGWFKYLYGINEWEVFRELYLFQLNRSSAPAYQFWIIILRTIYRLSGLQNHFTSQLHNYPPSSFIMYVIVWVQLTSIWLAHTVCPFTSNNSPEASLLTHTSIEFAKPSWLTCARLILFIYLFWDRLIKVLANSLTHFQKNNISIHSLH